MSGVACAANRELVALLRRWVSAAEDSQHSSTQVMTFRRAARSLANHAEPVACRADALRVKYIGDALAGRLQDWLDYDACKAQNSAQAVARLQHVDEGKWWTVEVCGALVHRRWGKRAGDGAVRPGMDNWERCASAAAALAWAVGKAAKQITRGYTHMAGGQPLFDAAKATVDAAKAAAAAAGRGAA